LQSETPKLPGKPAALKRSLTLPLLVLYGLGTTIGAGIYSLLGEVAGAAGYFAPVSFLLASIVAACTALSFAELSARYPQAAGVALYVKQGFSSERLSLVVGLLVVIAGVISSAALLNGFVGYVQEFVNFERTTIIIVTGLFLGAIAAWGIVQSVIVASLVTLVEIGGLYLVVAANGDALMSITDRWTELIPPLDLSSWQGIYIGLALAFYAYIGFEDMVEVAEEVKDVRRNLPIAIVVTIVITSLTYLLLMTTAVLAMPPDALAGSSAPLAALYVAGAGGQGKLISLVGLFAIINGALIQMIMSSRVLYGLSSRGLLPAVLANVNKRTQTPVIATLCATSTVVIFALSGGLATLANITATIIMCLFFLVNVSLWRIKRREPDVVGIMILPIWLPVAGAIVSLIFVLLQLLHFVQAS
jgi:amino acid transporter